MSVATKAIGSHVFHSQLQQNMSDCHYYHTASEEFYSTPLSGLFMYVCINVCMNVCIYVCMYLCIYLFDIFYLN